MLDRLRTELIQLVVDATSNVIWTRKATLDRLSLVNKSFRAALRPLRSRIVRVASAEDIVALRSWPAAGRKAVITVLIGSNDDTCDLVRLGSADVNRLMSLLPQTRHVFIEGIEGLDYDEAREPCATWFEFDPTDSNPFRKCVSLSLRRSRVWYTLALETTAFALHRLWLDLEALPPLRSDGGRNLTQPGLSQLLSKKSLPFLRVLHLSCKRLPPLELDLIRHLEVVQIDLESGADLAAYAAEIEAIGLAGPPVLFSSSFSSTVGRGLTLRGIQYLHLPSDRFIWKVLPALPTLMAVSVQVGLKRYSRHDILKSSLIYPTSPVVAGIRSKKIGVFLSTHAQNSEQFVDAGFLEYLRQKRA